MLDMLEERVSAKGTLKGKLDVYRYIDNVWTFALEGASLRLAPTQSTPKKDEEEVVVEGYLKMVLVDQIVVETHKRADAQH